MARVNGLNAGVLALCLMGSMGAQAAGLQVSPVTLTLAAAQQADGLTLTNLGDAPLQAQVRVFRWTQEDGQDRLEPTRAVLLSPPMLQLPVQGQQLVRVIRAGPPPTGAVEEAYRVLVDELPVPSESGARKGLSFVMRHSLPIFLLPAGAVPSSPQLQWRLLQDGGQVMLEAANTGSTRAQVADLSFTNASGQRTQVHAGLLGYVLPGVRMRWALQTPASVLSPGGQWQVMINGTTGPQAIPALEGAR